MEKWDLYNAKREKSGITMCRGEIIPKGLYHLSVSVWIVNQQGQYLLSQRHPKKQYPLYWECTGGSVLSGETSLQGAIREVKEELGILLTPGSEKLIYQTRRENVQDFYDVWLFHRDIKIEEMRLQETEVVDVQWVSSDRPRHRSSAQAQSASMKAAVCSLSSKIFPKKLQALQT